MTYHPALLDVLSRRNLGVLATIKRNGRPQLSNVNYHFDRERMLILISLTSDRVKVKNLQRDPRSSFLVASDDGWSYTVVEGHAEFSAVTTTPGDAASDELVEVYRLVAGKEHPDWDEYRQAMIDDRRLVGRLSVEHAYGLVR